MVEAITEMAEVKARPFLGICVGMQLLASRGLEYRVTQGLGWIPGDVQMIQTHDASLKIPHMGWNTLHPQDDHALLDGIPLGPDGLHAYFVHSYALVPKRPTDVVALAEYGGNCAACAAGSSLNTVALSMSPCFRRTHWPFLRSMAG